ncbi:hypothetical protein Tco_1394479 [Tanacetum coccineum]
MVFNSPCLTDKKELIHHEVEMVINSPWIMPLLGTKELASPEQTATGFSKYSCQDSEQIGCCLQSSLLSILSSAGRCSFILAGYVVPAGKVIIIVSPGRLSLVPTGRVLSHGRVK